MNKYLNLFSMKNKQRYIYESIIDENIPKDLLNAYVRSSGHPSQRHYLSDHSQLQSASRGSRKSLNYGYGSSDYREISAEEAARLVRQDKHNIENMRILYNGDLVEYEVRDNGSIYAIYGDSINRFTITNPDGTSNSYKNIRFAPWRSVLNVADKIYYTDEYSHPINNTERSERDNIRTLYKPTLEDEEGYDKHKPYDMYTRVGQTFANIPDTGSHNIDDIIGLTDDVKSLRKLKDDDYTKYDLARRALKKLEQEKDDYDEYEYSEKYDRLSTKVNEYLKNYNDAAKAYSAIKAKYLKWVDDRTLAVQTAISNFLKQVQDQLDLRYKLWREYQDQSRYSINNKLKYDSRVGSIKNDLSQKIDYLKSVQSEVNNLSNISDDIQNNSNTDSDLAIKLQELINLQDQLDTIKSEYANNHIEDLSRLQSGIDAAETRYHELKPKSYQKELIKKAEDEKEHPPQKLDPKLTNIVQFVNFADNKA